VSRKNYRKQESKRQQRHVVFALVSLVLLVVAGYYYHYEIAHEGAQIFGFYFFEMIVGKFVFGE
jgi:hypothetical protein